MPKHNFLQQTCPGLLITNPNDGTTLLGTARDVRTRAHAGTLLLGTHANIGTLPLGTVRDVGTPHRNVGTLADAEHRECWNIT